VVAQVKVKPGASAPPQERERPRTEMKPPPHIDLKALDPPPRLRRLRGGIRTATWRNPGALSESSQDAVYSAIVDLCTTTFCVDFDRYWQRRREMDYLGALTNFTLVVTPEDEVVAFTSHQMGEFAGARTLYVDSTSVHPAYQTQGLMAPLFGAEFFAAHLRRPHRRMNMIVRTENPVVYAAMATMLGPDNMYPAPDRPTPKRIQEIGAACAEWLRRGDASVFTPLHARFDPEELKTYDAYADPLYDKLPRSGLRPLDAFFHASLRPVDAFLVSAPAKWRELVPFYVRQRLASLRYRRELPATSINYRSRARRRFARFGRVGH